jgi:hypothetical protein
MFKIGKETEVLIEKVIKYAYLYNTSHEPYKNAAKEAEACKVIAEELDK